MEVFALSYLSLICALEVRSLGNSTGSIMSVIRTPLGVIILLIVILVLAGLTAVSAISGSLTAAAITGASLLVVVILLAVVGVLGK